MIHERSIKLHPSTLKIRNKRKRNRYIKFHQRRGIRFYLAVKYPTHITNPQ